MTNNNSHYPEKKISEYLYIYYIVSSIYSNRPFINDVHDLQIWDFLSMGILHNREEITQIMLIVVHELFVWTVFIWYVWYVFLPNTKWIHKGVNKGIGCE